MKDKSIVILVGSVLTFISCCAGFFAGTYIAGFAHGFDTGMKVGLFYIMLGVG